MDLKTIGRWLLIAGLVLALIIALWGDAPEWILYLLLLFGLVAGWFGIPKEDELQFFVVAITLFAFSEVLNPLPTIGPILTDVLGGIGQFLGAAAVSLVVRNLWRWLT